MVSSANDSAEAEAALRDVPALMQTLKGQVLIARACACVARARSSFACVCASSAYRRGSRGQRFEGLMGDIELKSKYIPRLVYGTFNFWGRTPVMIAQTRLFANGSVRPDAPTSCPFAA